MNTHNLRKMFCKSLARLKKASPTILSCLGSAGVAVTAVLTARSTIKAVDLMERDRQKASKPEIVKKCWKYYIPPAISGAATVLCVIGSNVLSNRQILSLTGAYTMLAKSYRDYRRAAKEVYGDDADDKIIAMTAKEQYISSNGIISSMSLYDPGLDESDKVLFFDSFANRYFTSTLSAVINAEYHLNRNLALRGCASLNEFYGFLGIDDVEGGDDVGWCIDKLLEDFECMWLDFNNIPADIDDGTMECYIITAIVPPELNYDE